VKPTGKHPDRALNPLSIRALSRPGRYADGNGLYLTVDPRGGKRWLLRVVVQGRRRDIGLGSYALVTLSEAREKAQAMRRSAREGRDPISERRTANASAPTFRECARKVHASHRAGWKNRKHAAQWLATLEAYAFPSFGDRRVDQVTTADILRALSDIWLTKPETARRVRQRIGTVLDWAKAAGFRSGDNPVNAVAKGLPRQNDRATHHAAVPYAEVSAFLARLATTEAGASVKGALEFLVLTAARTSEVVDARWSEIDFETATWIVPAERMKAGREHRVPLSARAVELLQEAKTAPTGEFVFPGRSAGSRLSNMALLMLMRRMGETATAHGFRSAFRDWASEQTNVPNEVCEMALAHMVKNKTEAAYRRTDLLEKRRQLMENWAEFLRVPEAEVVQLRA